MHPAVKVIGGIAAVGAAAVAGAVFGVIAASYEITKRLSYEEIAYLVKDELVGPLIEGALGMQALHDNSDELRQDPRRDADVIISDWFAERFGFDPHDEDTSRRLERRSRRLHRGKFGRFPWGD